jgi:hypothetical protein
MKSSRELHERWSRLVSEIATPQPMLRGSLCETRMKRKRADGTTYLSPPTTLYTRKVKGRTVSRSLNAQNLPPVREAVENFHRFQGVVEEFKSVGEELARTEGTATGSWKKNSST